jgi:hypothetical protein
MGDTPISQRPTQMHPENSPNFQGAHGVIMMAETSKLLPWLMLTCLFSGVSLIISFWAISEAQKSSREARLLEQQVMDQNALLLREGLRQPSDFSNGPAGNLQYRRKEK